MYFQFVSQHPRATEEVLPSLPEVEATVLLATCNGEVEEVYVGVYLRSEARLIEQVVPQEKIQARSFAHRADRDSAVAYARDAALKLARIH
ncbi:hypothetical protein NRL37_26490 [Metapseudomonas otitidis]|uniref:hypothetical protein n=1 Tax=Metapseudomonas otitidis TaxID=319939 RepID=UPI00227A17AB|nr:hypothetical protein [Pseudomonas otitidis]WAF85586.1 hypothetical protein NRL37_26490 [Pseudomonas otitidis]